jgi:CRP-like cAMP-binding protein
MFPSSSLLGQLPPEGVDRLAAAGSRVRYRHGVTLFVEGEPSGQVLMVLTGRVKVYSTSASGHESVLAIRGPGDLLGELAAIDGGRHSASGTTVETVELISVDTDRFLELVATDVGLATAMLRALVFKLRDADRARIEFGAEDTTTRVAGRLAELAAEYGVAEKGGVRIDLPITQQELAEWVGASREAVGKALHTLRTRGLVRTGRREIVVLDLPGLAARGNRPANA